MKVRAGIVAVVTVVALVMAPGCHSYHVETTVENHTGGPIRLLEVEYPSASFGVNSMAAGEEYHYRIQLRGSGPIKVQYTGIDGQKIEVAGPMLVEQQEGRLEIVLLPGGKVEFHPELTDAIDVIK
jgi:tRNA U38,U39,U40 pseudouridine synthase TruA